MKNKFKKIIPLILCFVMILGSCLTVNAARISSDKGNVGDTFSFGVNIFVPYNNYYRSYLVSASITNASDEVRVTPMLYISDNDYFASTLLICSKKPFSIDYQADSIFNSKNAISYSEIVFDKTKSTDSNSVKYNGVTYYYLNVGSSSMLTGSADVEVLNLSASPIDPTFYDPNYDRSNFGLLLEKLYLADFTWDDGKSSVYDTQPTAEIEPPKNLSIYRGYSRADQQYKFQMQWDEPSDPDLRVEVMYNVHWKDGTNSAIGLGEHHYKDIMSIRYEGNLLARVKKLQFLEDDLLTTLFQASNMEVPTYKNINKIYVRFAKEVDGVIQYSLWRKN